MTISMADTLAVLPAARTGRIITPAIRGFFACLPKVELHCHLLGAMRAATFADLARVHAAPISAQEIAGYYARGQRPVGVLAALRAMEQHLLLGPADFARIMTEYLEDAAAGGVRHAEVFWNPTPTLARHGLPYGALQQAMVQAMEAAEARLGISSLLIPAIDREAGAEAALAMVQTLLAHRHPRVPGIGIDYRETEHPPELFVAAYALARAHGLKTTAHAGEFGTPWGNVATAINALQVDRVDHGYTLVDNPALVAQARARGLVFTVVPTNSYYLRTLGADEWAAKHPIRAMLAAGLALHPNTDDPTLHQVTPPGAWELMYSHLGADVADLRAMMLAGIAGSWASDAQKAQWHAQWPAWFDAAAAGLGWQPSQLPPVA
jgi:adenosine deaminase